MHAIITQYILFHQKINIVWEMMLTFGPIYSFIPNTVYQWHCLPCKIAADVSKDFHEVRMDRGEGHAGRLAHVDGAFLSQVHVVEIDELKLRLLLWPTTTF